MWTVPATPGERVRLELAYGVTLDLRIPTRPEPRRGLLFTLSIPDNPNTITGRDLEMRLLDNQQVTITVAEEDAFGDPVPDDKRGQLTATSSDENVVTVQPVDGQPGQFLVRAVDGADGVSASVLVSDDVNGDGTGDFQGSIDFDLVDHRRGQVSQLVVAAGTPEDKPSA